MIWTNISSVKHLISYISVFLKLNVSVSVRLPFDCHMTEISLHYVYWKYIFSVIAEMLTWLWLHYVPILCWRIYLFDVTSAVVLADDDFFFFLLLISYLITKAQGTTDVSITESHFFHNTTQFVGADIKICISFYCCCWSIGKILTNHPSTAKHCGRKLKNITTLFG